MKKLKQYIHNKITKGIV